MNFRRKEPFDSSFCMALMAMWMAKRLRFHLHFTPTSASWLNLVERWFVLLTDKQLRCGVHRSAEELETAISSYIQHHNKNPNHSSDTKPQIRFSIPSPVFYTNFRLTTLLSRVINGLHIFRECFTVRYGAPSRAP